MASRRHAQAARRAVAVRGATEPAGAGRLWEARERILLAAAVADLRQQLYQQQLVLEALTQLLDEAGLVERAELEARVSALDAAP